MTTLNTERRFRLILAAFVNEISGVPVRGRHPQPPPPNPSSRSPRIAPTIDTGAFSRFNRTGTFRRRETKSDALHVTRRPPPTRRTEFAARTALVFRERARFGPPRFRGRRRCGIHRSAVAQRLSAICLTYITGSWRRGRTSGDRRVIAKAHRAGPRVNVRCQSGARARARADPITADLPSAATIAQRALTTCRHENKKKIIKKTEDV